MLIAPDAPVDLTATRNTDTLNTYTFTWTPPSVLNGELRHYELTCDPVGGGAPSSRMTFGPRVTMGDLTDLQFGVAYECTVRARNMAASSLPSNTVLINVTESGRHGVWLVTVSSDSSVGGCSA